MLAKLIMRLVFPLKPEQIRDLISLKLTGYSYATLCNLSRSYGELEDKCELVNDLVDDLVELFRDLSKPYKAVYIGSDGRLVRTSYRTSYELLEGITYVILEAMKRIPPLGFDIAEKLKWAYVVRSEVVAEDRREVDVVALLDYADVIEVVHLYSKLVREHVIYPDIRIEDVHIYTEQR